MSPLTLSERSRAEYAARIHKVMDFVEVNLGTELRLAELARVAGFSPYHFHRLFGALTGESPYQFILRLRLERAASQLAARPDKDVTSIALDCGFSSPSTFARAFKAAFGTSASEFRRNCKADRKDCKAVSKRCEARSTTLPYGEDITAPSATERADASDGRIAMTEKPMPTSPDRKPATSTRVVEREPRLVAYVRHVGPYAGDAQLFQNLFAKLCGWAGPRGLLTPSGEMFTIYHDNPEITEEQKLRISVCLTVPPGTVGSSEVGIMEVPGGKYAVASFELLPSEFGAAWNWFMGEWFPQSGFVPDDRPCFERCLNDPATHPEQKHLVELWEPVRPL